MSMQPFGACSARITDTGDVSIAGPTQRSQPYQRVSPTSVCVGVCVCVCVLCSCIHDGIWRDGGVLVKEAPLVYLLGHIQAAKEVGDVLVAALPRQSARPHNALAVDLIVDGTAQGRA